MCVVGTGEAELRKIKAQLTVHKPLPALLLGGNGASEGQPPLPLAGLFAGAAISIGAGGDEKHRLIDFGGVCPLVVSQHFFPKTVLKSNSKFHRALGKDPWVPITFRAAQNSNCCQMLILGNEINSEGAIILGPCLLTGTQAEGSKSKIKEGRR